MRYIYIVLAFVSFSASAQTKEDKRILVTAKDTVDLFNRIATSLYAEGYTLETRDDKALFLMTAEEATPRWNMNYKIKAMVKGDIVTITPVINIPFIDKKYDEYGYSKRTGTATRSVWDVAHKIALSIGTDIKYSK